MSRIRANQITNQAADGAPTVQHGLIIAGVSTFTGSVSIGGTLTYEDVTNIDSVGIVTARGGIHIDDSIVHIGDTNTKIRFPAADTITAETGGSEKLRITSGGQVNIGGDADNLTQTTYPFSVSGSTGGNNQINIVQRLKYSGASNQYNNGVVIAFTNTETNANAYSYIGARIDSGSSGANANALVFATNATNTAPTEKLRIDSSGRLLLGTTTLGDASADNLNIADSGHCGVTIRSGSSNYGNLFFTDLTSGDQFQGYVQYNHSDNSLKFGTNKIARLHIHSTGQVTKPASCAFNVTHNGSQNYSSAGTHTITSWKTTDSRGFENTTTGGYFGSGIFTAPVTGAYFFTSTLLLKDIGGTNGVHVWWSKNDGVHSYWETRFNGNSTGYGNYEAVSGQCTMYMSAGDTCRIKINFSGSSCGIHGDDQNWGNWGGFLIG